MGFFRRNRDKTHDEMTASAPGSEPATNGAADGALPPATNGASNTNGSDGQTATASPPAPPTPAAASAPTMVPATATNGAFVSTMGDFPLTLQHSLDRAARLFPHREIVTNTADGPQRTTYGEWAKRVNRLAYALEKLGVKQGDRVATLGWNTATHLELYFGAPCMGAVLHTLNLRLFPQDVAYIINDAQDSVIFVDADLLPILEKISDQLGPVRNLVVTNGKANPTDASKLPPILDYEELLAAAPNDTYPWPELDERQAAAMCYTSGTTGNPKGVVYSHRSVLLHSISLTQTDVGALSERDRVMPFVPMFHANAWGLAHAAPLVGATLIFPGRLMDPQSVTNLIASEKVTMAAGVPTIWIGMVQLLDKDPGAYDLSACSRIVCGGSAVTLALIEGLQRHNLNIIQAWGMTEMSPVGSFGRLRSEIMEMPVEDQYAARAKAGVPVPLVDFRVLDESGNPVPWDGVTFGELQVRGPWVTMSYYHGGDDNVNKFSDGWLRTGDVVTLDPYGYIGIVDRTKDVIKSGGEWISSVNLEGLIMGHPQVLEAAVIGVPDPKWQERPVAYVVPKPDFKDTLTKEDIIAYLEPKIAKWWLPEEVIMIDAVPKTSVGKFDKKVLRAQHAAEHTPAE
ncbi:MAG TPA: long-chain fatty acid--CoA ligase [Ktedonobacterales bacterium]|jgi:fatty-acyl-CoA synthase